MGRETRHLATLVSLAEQQTFGAVRYRTTTGTVVPDDKENLPRSVKFQSSFESWSSFEQWIRVVLSGFGWFFRTEKFFRTADSGGSFRIRVVLSKFWEFFQNFKKCFRMDVDAFFDGWWVCFRIFWSAFEWMSMLFSTDVEGSFEWKVLQKWMMGVLLIPPNFYTSDGKLIIVP